MHVTLVNARHKNNGHSESSNDNRYYSFNAVPILNKFSSTEFGHNRIESIHISKIGQYDEHGRHRSEGCIRLP